MLILLDIDGVMVPHIASRRSEFLDDGFPVFSFKAVQALQKIILETDAKLILTTSHKSRYTLAEWRDIFLLRGITINDINRLSSDDLTRKDEILNWYSSGHNSDENFVIIDDDKLLSDLPVHIKEKLVLTSASVGLTDDLANEAIRILKRGAFTHV